MAEATSPPGEIQQQAAKILSQVSGYIGVCTIDIGLRRGIFSEIAKHPQGISAEEIAGKLGFDPLYTRVWCRSAFASEILEQAKDGYTLAPQMDTLLLDPDSPAYIGAMPGLLQQPEVFERFSENLDTGKRTWWDECSPSFIQYVSGTGRAYYNRMIPDGLSRVPGLEERLSHGARFLDLACGAGIGLARMVRQWPQSSFVGVDGDEHSLHLAREIVNDAGAGDRVSLVQSTLEDLSYNNEFDAVLINISMHECRDIEKVAENVHRALKPGGIFVISDLPFPESEEQCRTVPARIMSGIQFFEAQIDDQLLPTSFYMDLLKSQGFQSVDAFDITPVHAVTYGVT